MVLMPTALFFRPNTDLALSYGKEWLARGIEEAVKRGFNVIDLVDEACTFDTLKNILETEKIDVVILLGHGNANIFTGFEQQIVLEACHNDQIMSGTISHFVSCLIGQELLPSIIEKKGIWTIGYQTTFDFMIEPPEAVEPFSDITLAVIAAILDGGKLKEAWDAGIAKGEEWKTRLWNRPETWCAEVIQLIDKDIHGMVGLGDKEAYVLPLRKMALSPQGLIGLAALFWFLISRGA